MAVDPQFRHPDLVALMRQYPCFDARALEHRDDGLGMSRAGNGGAGIIGSLELRVQHVAHAARVAFAGAGIIAVDQFALLS